MWHWLSKCTPRRTLDSACVAQANVLKGATGCHAPTFLQHTRQPYFIGVQDLLFHCLDEYWEFREEATFSIYHTEAQSDCLFDGAGKPVFDFTLRCCPSPLPTRSTASPSVLRQACAAGSELQFVNWHSSLLQRVMLEKHS